MAHPAFAGRARFDIADIVRAHRVQLEAAQPLSAEQRRVLSAIALCRTAALGGHLEVCRSCGHEQPAYNSCRNRHCPKCQALAQERWIAARAERVLPTAHFHVVFTLPSELRPLAKAFPRAIFDALFRATGETLLELSRSRFQATLGATLVLHTWTRDLRFHPHVHALVTAGGLALDESRWVNSSRKYLFPVKMMGALLRGKMIAALHRAHADGRLDAFDGFSDPERFGRLMARLARTSWVVYAKKPFKRIDHVLKYLGRYTHRVGIANSRIVDATDDAVTFGTKNGNTVTLEPVEFLSRFVQHVLPTGFKKIRHYGLYSGAHVAHELAQARSIFMRSLSGATAPPQKPRHSWAEHLLALTGRDVLRCPLCGGDLERRPLVAMSRAPPRAAA